MTARLRVGVLGLHHDHVWSNLAAVATGALGQLVAVAEPSPRLRERLSREHGGVALHPAYDALLDPVARGRGYFRPESVQGLLDRHVKGLEDRSPAIWTLLMFELWHREMVDGPRHPSPALASVA